MQQAREQSAQIWDEYGRIRDSNNYEIERLRAEANSEHQQMLECFERVSECYFSDKSEASYWSQQGHGHKERRDELNEEVRRLCEEFESAQEEFKCTEEAFQEKLEGVNGAGKRGLNTHKI